MNTLPSPRPLRRFDCWDILLAEQDDAKLVMAHTPKDAAAKYAERIWEHAGYPDSAEIGVRDDRGDVRMYVVDACHKVTFYATQKVGKKDA